MNYKVKITVEDLDGKMHKLEGYSIFGSVITSNVTDDFARSESVVIGRISPGDAFTNVITAIKVALALRDGIPEEEYYELLRQSINEGLQSDNIREVDVKDISEDKKKERVFAAMGELMKQKKQPESRPPDVHLDSFAFAESQMAACKMPLIVITKHPEDYPDKYVTRLFDLGKGTPYCVLSNTLQQARKAIPQPRFMNIGRQEEDDPVIVETWV